MAVLVDRDRTSTVGVGSASIIESLYS